MYGSTGAWGFGRLRLRCWLTFCWRVELVFFQCLRLSVSCLLATKVLLTVFWSISTSSGSTVLLSRVVEVCLAGGGWLGIRMDMGTPTDSIVSSSNEEDVVEEEEDPGVGGAGLANPDV